MSLIKKIKPYLRPIYGSAFELIMISKWLLLKALAFVYLLFRNKDSKVKASKKFITFANKFFSPPVPYDIYKSYDEYLKSYNTNQVEFTLYNDIQKENLWLKGKKILDLGGGCGHYSVRLLEEGAADVTLLEIQTRKTDYATKNFGTKNNLTIVNDSAYHMPFEDNTFDSIFSHTVFEHITDMQKTLEECQRVLKPGGLLMIGYNYFHHYGGSHLFPYIHFPWANWLIKEETVCEYWTEKMLADVNKGWSYYDESCTATHLGTGSEMNLNKLNFDEFETMVKQNSFEIINKKPSGALVQALPFLGKIPKIKFPLSGTIFYAIQKK